jgi:hypothetical protein
MLCESERRKKIHSKHSAEFLNGRMFHPRNSHERRTMHEQSHVPSEPSDLLRKRSYRAKVAKVRRNRDRFDTKFVRQTCDLLQDAQGAAHQTARRTVTSQLKDNRAPDSATSAGNYGEGSEQASSG